jgi:hypothetical protein
VGVSKYERADKQVEHHGDEQPKRSIEAQTNLERTTRNSKKSENRTNQKM